MILKIKHSNISLDDEILIELINKFDLANSTPYDCMKFIDKLKKLVNGIL